MRNPVVGLRFPANCITDLVVSANRIAQPRATSRNLAREGARTRPAASSKRRAAGSGRGNLTNEARACVRAGAAARRARQGQAGHFCKALQGRPGSPSRVAFAFPRVPRLSRLSDACLPIKRSSNPRVHESASPRAHPTALAAAVFRVRDRRPYCRPGPGTHANLDTLGHTCPMPYLDG